MHTDVENVYREFSDGLRRLIHNRVTDEQAVEDILQDVFLKIHTALDSLRDGQRLDGWVYQIARNAIIDYYRSRRPLTEMPEDLRSPEVSDEHDPTESLAPSVRGMIQCLPEKYRTALLLTELGELTQQELAAQLGLSLSGAKSRVQRGREKLKELFLDCCHFELDHLGQILSYHPRCPCCSSRGGGGCGERSAAAQTGQEPETAACGAGRSSRSGSSCS